MWGTGRLDGEFPAASTPPPADSYVEQVILVDSMKVLHPNLIVEEYIVFGPAALHLEVLSWRSWKCEFLVLKVLFIQFSAIFGMKNIFQPHSFAASRIQSVVSYRGWAYMLTELCRIWSSVVQLCPCKEWDFANW